TGLTHIEKFVTQYPNCAMTLVGHLAKNDPDRAVALLSNADITDRLLSSSRKDEYGPAKVQTEKRAMRLLDLIESMSPAHQVDLLTGGAIVAAVMQHGLSTYRYYRTTDVNGDEIPLPSNAAPEKLLAMFEKLDGPEKEKFLAAPRNAATFLNKDEIQRIEGGTYHDWYLHAISVQPNDAQNRILPSILEKLIEEARYGRGNNVDWLLDRAENLSPSVQQQIADRLRNDLQNPPSWLYLAGSNPWADPSGWEARNNTRMARLEALENKLQGNAPNLGGGYGTQQPPDVGMVARHVVNNNGSLRIVSPEAAAMPNDDRPRGPTFTI
ncbi:MAG TPA: hypothetical protein PKW15_06895, partial [Alphaproteobacteria bacterium]|nr:hypothetical protein [Alphaproteobacteria bacterium]